MQLAQPVILNSKGKPMHYSLGEYNASVNTRQRKLHGTFGYQTKPESEMLQFSDRLKILSYLRRSIRNNPVMAALTYRYALAIGSPTIHATTLDGDFNNVKERNLERRLRSIMHGTGWSWHRMHMIISMEEFIAGEVFAVEVDDKVQLIPSEFCGQPANPDEGEIDGITYDETGAPLFYRFGVRKKNNGSATGSVSFEEEDGAQLVPAEFVSHIGSPSRIEERRFSPKLSSVIEHIQHLDDIVKAKVTTVKNQAAISLFFTKTFDPALFAESSALSSAVEGVSADLVAQAQARSAYQDIKNGAIMYGEVGEDVKLIEPNLQAQDFSQFALFLLDMICSVTPLCAEEVLVGYRNSNYSSARTDRIKMAGALTDARKNREAFCDKIIARQTGIAVDSGELKVENDGIADISYGWPVLREIDESKHVLAQGTALANGSKSLDMVCAENATFADVVQGQILRSATRMAKMIKAASLNVVLTPEIIAAQTVTQSEIIAHMPNAKQAGEALNAIANAEAATVNADANAANAGTTSTNEGGAMVDKTPIPQAQIDQVKPALIDKIGIGGTQALISVLQQVAAGIIPRAQGIATLELLFGITNAEASSMVPEKGTAEPIADASNLPTV